MFSKRDSPVEKSAKRLNKAKTSLGKSRQNAEHQDDYKERVLSQVREMFDSILEPDVILSVVQNCNWKLQPSIEYLISLSANINTSEENGSNLTNFNADLEKEDEGAAGGNRNSSPEEDAFEVDTDFTYLNIDDEELQKQKEEFKRFELMRKHEQNSNEDFPLDALQVDNTNLDNFFDEFISSMHGDKSSETSPNQAKDRRKTETESLCGLKIQYRFGSPEASSDDDADVVIENESSDQINPEDSPTNVCQFSSPSTETSPKTTVEMITTSPINERFKPGFNATLTRIKSTIQRGYKIMVIIRGLPGSGKTHLANSIAQLANDDDPAQFIFSTDDFFMKKGRIYDFDPMKLPDAHSFNQQRVAKAATNGISPIIVDNTNTQYWEMKPYVVLAVQYGYFIEVLEPNTRWAFNLNELTKRNIHDVPKHSIQRMLDRFEKNITAAKLMKEFALKYESFNKPPQPCLNDRVIKKTPEIQKKSPNLRFPQKENLSALQLALKTFGGDDDDLSPKNTQDLIEDKWDENGTSWETEQLKSEIDNQESNKLKQTLNDESSSYRPFILKVADNAKNVHEVNKIHPIFPAIGSEKEITQDLIEDKWDENGTSWETEQLKSEIDNQESNNLRESLNEESSIYRPFLLKVAENAKNVHEVNPILGAIGSERKNSFIQNSLAKDSEIDNNVLSRCWDFTLLLDGQEIHSVAPEDHSPENSNNSTISRSSIQSDIDNSETKPKSPTEELKEAANDKDSPDSGTKSSTESFEHIDSNSEDSSFEIRDVDPKETNFPDDEIERNSSDPETKGSFGLIMKFIKKSFLGENDSKSGMKSSETVVDSLTEKLHSPVKEHYKTKTLDYEHWTMPVSEQKIASKPETDVDTLSKKLAGLPQSPKKPNLVCEPQGNFDFLEVKSNEEPNNEISSSENNLSSYERLVSILAESENLNAKFETIKLTEENEKLILEEKEIRVENSREKLETKFLPTESEQMDHQLIDNINSISWKESPFPIYEMQVPEKVEESKTIATAEAGTNTNIYDFNVSFIGGTNESEYKILETLNRSINEGKVPSTFDSPPPRILKLDKSTMTNEVDILMQLPDTCGESDREMIQGLMDMFPHIPKEDVVDVYKNLCQCNSHRAIDVLLDGVPTGIRKSTTENSSPMKMDDCRAIGDSSEGAQSRKKDKSIMTEDVLELKKHLEEKVMISEASYHPDTLRVRKWRNGEPYMSKKEIIEAQGKNQEALRFANDSSPVELDAPEVAMNSENVFKEKEESDSDESTESEGTMEFDLGWEFIKNLESQFGNTDFQMPDGLFPVIQLKKSLAQEIYALWIESKQQQMNDQQEQLDAMIAKDAEYAKSLEEAEAKAFTESTAPSLNEIMDMELALAVYKNDLKKQQERETPNDMASRLTRQRLNEMFPNTDPEILSEILKAHNGNFKETVQVLEASTGHSLNSSDNLDKQNSLIDKLKQQSLSKEDSKSKATSSKTNAESEELTYDEVLDAAHRSRREAERQFSFRNENFNKASRAFRNGNPAVASYYSEVAKLHSKKMESANASAASAFLAAQTHVLGEENTLDLHNLFVPEAMQALDIFLDHQLQILNSQNRRSVEILIITGRGARSSNKKSKIKPAVSKRLTSRNIGFTEANPGCLKAKLYRRNSST